MNTFWRMGVGTNGRGVPVDVSQIIVASEEGSEKGFRVRVGIRHLQECC